MRRDFLIGQAIADSINLVPSVQLVGKKNLRFLYVRMFFTCLYGKCMHGKIEDAWHLDYSWLDLYDWHPPCVYIWNGPVYSVRLQCHFQVLQTCHFILLTRDRCRRNVKLQSKLQGQV